MPSTPGPSAILKLLDEERRVGADAGANIEKTPHVVRYLSSNWNGITYSCFSSEKADQIIGAEIDRFSRLGGTFKWKVYSHDEPRILLEKLAERGFKQGEEEALMVAPTKDLPETLFRPHSNQITIKELTDESMIDDVFAIETAVWKSTHRSREEMISNLQDSLKRDVGFIAYFKEQPAGFARVTCSAGSQFAGLWGAASLKSTADAVSIAHYWRVGSSMRESNFPCVFCVSMLRRSAVEYWKSRDSSKSQPAGLTNGPMTGDEPFGEA